MILPATYVAITTFHQEMAPTLLIIAIAAQREAVPFPAYFEALLMEITFEVLREAGVQITKSDRTSCFYCWRTCDWTSRHSS